MDEDESPAMSLLLVVLSSLVIAVASCAYCAPGFLYFVGVSKILLGFYCFSVCYDDSEDCDLFFLGGFIWMIIGCWKEDRQEGQQRDAAQRRIAQDPVRRARRILEAAQLDHGDHNGLATPLLSRPEEPLAASASDNGNDQNALEEGLSTFDRLQKDTGAPMQENQEHVASTASCQDD